MIEDRELEPMLRVRDVARLLHVHVNTVRRWSDHGVIPAYRINRRGDRRFKREEINQFLARLQAGAVVEGKVKRR